MGPYGVENNRFPNDEGQPFVPPAGNHQVYQPPAVDFRRHPVIFQVAPQHQAPLELRRRRRDCSDTLRRIFCWGTLIVGLTCAVVFGLLFVLKYTNSPLLCRSEGRNDLTETILIEGSGQKACRPCVGTEQKEGSSSKQPNCCNVNVEALQKLIETVGVF